LRAARRDIGTGPPAALTIFGLSSALTGAFVGSLFDIESAGGIVNWYVVRTVAVDAGRGASLPLLVSVAFAMLAYRLAPGIFCPPRGRKAQLVVYGGYTIAGVVLAGAIRTVVFIFTPAPWF
jgi:hypothetical protein